MSYQNELERAVVRMSESEAKAALMEIATSLVTVEGDKEKSHDLIAEIISVKVLNNEDHLEEQDKIKSEKFNPNIPFSDQREEIYGDMKNPPPNYGDGE
ncbi:hypothetical protein EVU96_24790 [Bacillus infantis]|uniref:hypothetical protein n=1 Tax=Bacillus infantis TaxID=324767 RepID=UPI00101E0875|nr:hypothetical protein [Bacillus infantis]RYI25186.1 hypothetical protein EVU96_24790 [Bacillus infantis]